MDPEPISVETFWLDYEHLDPRTGQPTVVSDRPKDVPGGIFGWGNRSARAVKVERVTYDNGEIFDFKEGGGDPVYIKTDPQLAAQWRAEQKADDPQYQLREQDGTTYRIDLKTGMGAPVEGLPSPQPKGPDVYNWTDPMTGAQWERERGTGKLLTQLSPDIPGWVAGRGVPAPSEPKEPRNPMTASYGGMVIERDSNTGEWRPAFQFPKEPEEPRNPMTWSNGGNLYERDPDTGAWSLAVQGIGDDRDYQLRLRGLDQQGADAAARLALGYAQLEQARKEAQWQAANNMMEGQIRAAPMAAMPGQTYFMGAEPGGLLSNIARLSGRGYDAEQYRAPIQQYDPQAAWQRAQGMI